MQKALKLKFHGRVLDQLGLQAHQSLPASLAEMAASERDAKAARVEITLPTIACPASEIAAGGNRCGMTLEECQEKYLGVGCSMRNGNPGATTPGKRPAMGRKGTGNLAGFGTAKKAAAGTAGAGTGRTGTAGLPICPPCGRTGG